MKSASEGSLTWTVSDELASIAWFFLLPFLTTLLFLQAFREFIGQVYFQNLSEMTIGPSIILVFLLLSPAAVLILKRMQHRNLLIFTAIGVLVFRFIMPFVRTTLMIYVLAAGMSVAFYGVYLTVAVFMRPKEKSEAVSSGASLLSMAIALALAGDLTLRALGVTWDPTTGPLGVVITPSLCVITGIVVYTSHSSSQQIDSVTEQALGMQSRIKAFFIGFGFGGIMFAILTFLAYPNVLARWGNGSYEIASISVIGGLIAYVLIASRVETERLLAQKPVLFILNLVALVVAVDLAYLLSPLATILGGVAVFAFMLNLQVLWDYLRSNNANLADHSFFHLAGMLLLLFLLLFSVITVAAGQILSALEGMMPYLILIAFVCATAPVFVLSAINREVFE